MSSPVESSIIQGHGEYEAHASVGFFVVVLIFVLIFLFLNGESETLLNTYEENLTMANLPWS